jgi:hypothetical protein
MAETLLRRFNEFSVHHRKTLETLCENESIPDWCKTFEIPETIETPAFTDETSTNKETLLSMHQTLDTIIMNTHRLYKKNTSMKGGSHKKASKRVAKETWVNTHRTVQTKSGAKKTLYRNSTTGELRVRKMTARRDGTRKVSYVKV